MFFSKLFGFLLILIVFDFLFGYFLHYLYFKQNHGRDYRTTYSMEQTNAEIITFGSSRGLHNYQSNLINNRLQYSCYNAGRDASYIFYHFAVLQSILQRYQPKLIILDINELDFYIDNRSYLSLNALLPYYDTHPEIRPIVELRGRYEQLKLLSHIYPYNSKFFSSLTGTLDIRNKRFEEARMNGFVPEYRTFNEAFSIGANEDIDQTIDTTKVQYFTSFVNECNARHLPLIVVVSPTLKKFDTERHFLRFAKDIATSNNAYFLNFTADTTFTSNKHYFRDMIHLNVTGSKIFTQSIIEKISLTRMLAER